MKTVQRISWLILPALLAVAQSASSQPTPPRSDSPRQATQPLGEPTQAQRTEAREAMAKASELFKQGKLEQALELYQSADDLMHVPSTAWNVANTLFALGKFVEARQKAVEVTEMPSAPGEARAFLDARQQARGLITELDAKLPSLLVMVRGAQPGEMVPGAVVTLDGQSFDPSTARLVDPGRHVVRVTAPGYEDATVEHEAPEGAGESKCVIELKPKPAPVLGGAVPVSEQPPAEQPPTPERVTPAKPLSPPPQELAWWDKVPTLAWVGFGVGAAGLGMGAVTGGFAWSATSTLKDEHCDGGTSCDGSYDDDKSSAETLATLSNIGFGVGALGIGLGVYALLDGPKENTASSAGAPTLEFKVGQHPLRFRPEVGVRSLSVRGEF